MYKLEMLIQSADARYESALYNGFYYNLSCSLLNIYKGRCNLIIAHENTNIKNEILIKHDRAIMEGNLKVNSAFFNSLPMQLGNKTDKPAKVSITINDKLNVNQDGVLYIEKEIKSHINEFQFFIPVI